MYSFESSYDGEFAAVMAIWLAAMTFTVIIYFVALVLSYVLLSWSLMALFEKTGIEKWKAWVPGLQYVMWLRLGGQNGVWGWLIFIPYVNFVTMVFVYIGMHRTGIAFRKETGFLVLGIFFPVIWAFILGYGKTPYEPYLLPYRGYPLPLEGYGSYDPARQQPTM